MAIAVVASTVSAVIALLLVRAAGWQLSQLVTPPGVDSLDARLRSAAGRPSCRMRLIPAVPFSVLNYAAGASAVRVLPYTLATLVGLLPGTAAVVILGDALTGNVSPLLVLVSLLHRVRRHRRPDLRDPHAPPPSPRAHGRREATTPSPAITAQR